MTRSAFLLVFVAAAALSQGPGCIIPAIPLQHLPERPGLPRVLVIGDSISRIYTELLRQRLADKFNVHHMAGQAGTSANGLAHVDQWLDDGPWNAVVFNFGLEDLRLKKDGGHEVEIPQYRANLGAIANRLHSRTRKVIFVYTTPIPENTHVSQRELDDIAAYNGAAISELTSYSFVNRCSLHSPSFPFPDISLRRPVEKNCVDPKIYNSMAISVALCISPPQGYLNQ